MIRINRSPEPPALEPARRKHLSRQILGRAYGGEPPAFEGYDCVKDELYQLQHRKCVYCERYTGKKGEAVEHFRPKEVYWWLAWTWDNLLFVCQSCNTGYKRTSFPLMPGTARLAGPPVGVVAEPAAACFEIEAESPLLLDPGCDDPLNHIEWRPENPDDEESAMRWRPLHKTRRGEQTIQTLGLRGELVDHVSDHLRCHVVGRLKPLRRACENGDAMEMGKQWEDLLFDLFHPSAPFQAATYDGLRFLVPRWYRERWGLREPPRPGASLRRQPRAPVFRASPLEASLPDALRLEVRAQRLKAKELVAKVWPHRPWSNAELADLLGVAVSTIQTALRELKLRQEGRL